LHLDSTDYLTRITHCSVWPPYVRIACLLRVVPDTYRIISDGDLVTGMPAAFMGFCHVGIAAYVDNKVCMRVLADTQPLLLIAVVAFGSKCFALRVLDLFW
jgi:hypothetical protein